VWTNWFSLQNRCHVGLASICHFLVLDPHSKGLGTNLKLSTNKIAWIHWSLDLGPLSKVALRPTLDNSPVPRQMKLWFSLHGIILEGNPIGPNQKIKKSFKESSWFGEPKCKLESKVVHFLIFFSFLILFFHPYCSNFVRMKDMLWIVL
jgi:hypothetical protein